MKSRVSRRRFNEHNKHMMKKNKPLGFSFLEVFITIAIIEILTPGAYALMASSVKAMSVSMHDVEATYLADEGMEAVRISRLRGWTNNIANKTNGTIYYPALSASYWTLSTDPGQGVINGIYTRSVVFSIVYRDTGSGDIVTSGGNEDAKTRLVTVTVSWPERGQTRSVSLQGYITNYEGS